MTEHIKSDIAFNPSTAIFYAVQKRNVNRMILWL